jgi:hypothetical protein
VGLEGEEERAMRDHGGYDVAYDYTVRFYPRWYFWVQQNLFTWNSDKDDGDGGQTILNRLTGPLGMGPEYKIVVAINDDTIYAQTFLDLSQQPVILTLPTYPTDYTYSILHLDVYGDVFSTSLSESPPHDGGSYAFVLQSQTAQVPKGVNPVVMPYPSSQVAIRIDKHTADGTDITSAASEFRAGLLLQTLDKFDPTCTSVSCGRTLVTPLFTYGASVKRMADETIAKAPEAFLNVLQQAMASPTTQPLTDDDRALMQRFNDHFTAAKNAVDTDSWLLTDLIRGAQAAYAAIVNRWQSHRGPTNWIHFDNIGQWGTAYLDRAALTEYIQCGNDRKHAYYADAFVDASGLPLDGGSFRYVIKFETGQLPQYTRFWSLTAYTPGEIELVPNLLHKYVVASYQKGISYGEDQSLTIYVQADLPLSEHIHNWLPVPKGPFSLLFRVYGPQGEALNGSYVVPKILRRPLLR